MNKFLCIIFILLFISKTENVFSNNLIYDVNKVEIKGKKKDNITKIKFIELAFVKAFFVFIDKTLLKEDAERLSKTKLETIKDLVLTYQIVKNKKNKIDNNDNILTFNIQFDPKKINNFLAKRKISYADISDISLILLPILIKDKKISLYEENFFHTNWNKFNILTKDVSEQFISYNLALENIEDLGQKYKFKYLP